MRIEIIPAVLVKKREELLERIAKVKPYVKTIQIDVMDGKFVNNTTLGIEGLQNLPAGVNYEFHWMVYHPESWIAKIHGDYLHLIHIESVQSWDWVERTVKRVGGRLGIALNPETPLEKILPFVDRVERVLVMTVHPGFSSQKYIYAMEEKIRKLREKFPQKDIEVDGGINFETAASAAKAGANKLSAATIIFSSQYVGETIRQLKACAEGL